MENNNVVVTTAATTIEHCGSKGGFPPPPQDLINNNGVVGISPAKHRPFMSPTSGLNDLQNEQLQKSAAPTTVSNNGVGGEGGLLEPSTGSVPDNVLTESMMVSATEVLTEILVKPAVGRQDSNGNDATAPQSDAKRYPNVSSSSTQTECSPSSSYRVCCCKEWNCWKSVAAAATTGDGDKSGSARCSGQCGQPSSTRPYCHHHRRKKANSGGTSAALLHDKTVTAAGCECGAVSSKYSKSWRELRKSSTGPPAHNKRSGGQGVICRFQSCNNNRNSSKPPV